MSIVLMGVALASGACSGNCQSLAERVCSFFDDSYFKTGSTADCMAKVKTYFGTAGLIRWEDEYRCGMYLKSCTREALNRGDPEECGLTSCGPFSPCTRMWRTICNCVWKDDPEKLGSCNHDVEVRNFLPEEDLVCGHQLLDTCTCEALNAGECAKCGFAEDRCWKFSPCYKNWQKGCECNVSAYPDDLSSCLATGDAQLFPGEQDRSCGATLDSCTCSALAAGECSKCGFDTCGPFSPCVHIWHDACDWVWGAYPAQQSVCHASVKSTVFTAEDDRFCGSSPKGCTQAALEAGDCGKCGMSPCGQFSPCKIIGYDICGCAVAGSAGQDVCRNLIDVVGYAEADDTSCGQSREACTCETLHDGVSCPYVIQYPFSPCRILSYQLCGCSALVGDQWMQCLTSLTGPGFTPEQDAACQAMKDSCTCDALASKQGCPDFLITRFGMAP